MKNYVVELCDQCSGFGKKRIQYSDGDVFVEECSKCLGTGRIVVSTEKTHNGNVVTTIEERVPFSQFKLKKNRLPE